MLKSIRGITEKDFKKLSDGELKALGLYRESKGVTTKYWEIQDDRLEGKAIVLTGDKKQVPKKHLVDGQPIIEAIASTAQQAFELAQSRGFGGLFASFKQNFGRPDGDLFGSKYGIERKQKDTQDKKKGYFYYDRQTLTP